MLPSSQPPFTVTTDRALVFVGDDQGRCLLLADAQAALALATLIEHHTPDESRPLRSPHVREILRVTPRPNGDVHVIRLDSEGFLQEDAPVLTDAELTLNPEQQRAFVQALKALVPPGTTTSARPADDLWSAR